jgi:16S rRNA (uracil1498-N3)-methyltransferase
MNLLILEEKEHLTENNYLLCERKSLHVLTVLRKKTGDTINAGIWNRSFGVFLVKEMVNETQVLGEYQFTKPSQPLSFNIQILSAIQRPQTTKKILQLASTCGVRSVNFFLSDKSEKSYLQSPVWQEESVNQEILLGLEQGKRVTPPDIKIFRYLNKLLETDFDNYPKLVLDPEGLHLSVYETEIARSNGAILAFGPESGFSDSEMKSFLNFGFTKISLSKTILRTEYAMAFALSQLDFITSRNYL